MSTPNDEADPDTNDLSLESKQTIRKETKDFATLMGIQKKKAKRRLERAKIQRKLMITKGFGMKIRGFSGCHGSKITKERIDEVHEWLRKHPEVIVSPVSNDCILIKKECSNEKHQNQVCYFKHQYTHFTMIS